MVIEFLHYYASRTTPRTGVRRGAAIVAGVALLLVQPSAAKSSDGEATIARPQVPVSICPATDGSIDIRPHEAEISRQTSRDLIAALGWTMGSGASQIAHVTSWFEASGPGTARIVSFIPNRVWLANRCAYTLRQSNSFRLAEGESWFRYDPSAPPSAVQILNAGETAEHAAVSIVLPRASKGSRLLVCRGPSNAHQDNCDLLISTPRKILAIRYLQSVDTLSGGLGIVERTPSGKLWLIGLSIDAGRLRTRS